MSVRRCAPLVLAIGIALVSAGVVFAQARHPFAIGGSEGSVPGGTFGLWLVTEQAKFTQAMTAALRETRTSAAAFLTLAGLSFGYGVFHAAGPGHGKAVMAAYMVANERALRRGLVLTAGAALLQAVIAIALVVVLRLVLGATAARMSGTAAAIETASYAIVAALGAWLVWRKGFAFFAMLAVSVQPTSSLAMAGDNPSSAFVCEAVDANHMHDATCGHVHAPHPASLGADFSWRGALAAMAAAGARPCSGAIVVLVFAIAQDLFYVGVAAVLFMALGTALTTGVLAALAVYAKKLALHVAGTDSVRGALVARGAEFCAALLVLAIGVALFLSSTFAQAVA